MHITLRQLEIFLGICDQKSLSKAAAKLCVTTSAASQSLKELERTLGTELFERKSNGLFPTDAASALLPLATLVVTKASEIEDIFAAREKGLAGKLIIGANRASGIYILSRRLPEFKRRYPTVDPTLLIEDNEIVEAGVLDNRMDWDEGTKNGPDRSALLGHNFVYQETKPHGFYSSYFHQRISS